MKRIVAFLFVLLLTIPTCFAYSVPDSTIVYITPSGTKYHRADCTYTTTVRSLTIQAAERQGYSPCSRCDPDFITGEYKSDWDGTSGSSAAQNSTNVSKPTPSPDSQPDSGSQSVVEVILTILSFVFLGLLTLGVSWSILYLLYAQCCKRIQKRRKRRSEK